MNFPATKVYLKLPLRENAEEFFRNNSFPSYQVKLSEMGLLLYPLSEGVTLQESLTFQW